MALVGREEDRVSSCKEVLLSLSFVVKVFEVVFKFSGGEGDILKHNGEHCASKGVEICLVD